MGRFAFRPEAKPQRPIFLKKCGHQTTSTKQKTTQQGCGMATTTKNKYGL